MFMAAILSYFTRNDVLSDANGMEVYDFTGSAVDFINDCLNRFRDAYVSEDKINDIVAKSKTETRKSIIERRFPTKTEIKAGDFGEIVSYYLWTETWGSDSTIRPFKWRWKEYPDMPSHLVDVILLKRVDTDSPNPNDKMYTVESKVWTSPMKEGYSSLTNALEGAITDKTERAAKAIPYLVIQYERDGEYDIAEQVKRFGDPVNNPFDKVHNAIAIVDSSQTNDHLANFNKVLQSTNPQIPIFYLPVNDLKNLYLGIYNQLPNS